VRTVGTLPVPIARITFNQQTRCYGFAFNFAGLWVHHAIETMESFESALRWADPWNGRIWEEPSAANESAVLVSTRRQQYFRRDTPVLLR
jgi:hypothetical protein